MDGKERILVITPWEHFRPILPFIDEDGSWYFGVFAERRRVIINGKEQWQKRSREGSFEEWIG